MKLLSKKNILLVIVITVALNSYSYAQQGSVTINQDPRIDELIKIKKEIDDTSNRYRIQIYSGSRANAEKKKSEFRSKFSKYSSKLVYETPNYKIWVGNFRTRLEVDRAFKEVKKKFPHAFIFKPQKGN